MRAMPSASKRTFLCCICACSSAPLHPFKTVPEAMSQNATSSTSNAPDKRDMQTLVGLIKQRQSIQAEALARELIDSYPSHGLLWQGLGAALHAQGRFAEAAEAQREAVTLSPWDAVAHYVLGESLMALQQPVLAAESYHLARSI